MKYENVNYEFKKEMLSVLNNSGFVLSEEEEIKTRKEANTIKEELNRYNIFISQEVKIIPINALDVLNVLEKACSISNNHLPKELEQAKKDLKEIEKSYSKLIGILCLSDGCEYLIHRVESDCYSSIKSLKKDIASTYEERISDLTADVFKKYL